MSSDNLKFYDLFSVEALILGMKKRAHVEDRNTIGLISLRVTLCLLTGEVTTVTRVFDEGHSHVINSRYTDSHRIPQEILHACFSEGNTSHPSNEKS